MSDTQHEPKVIAFFLPQFHPIPENDLWWGEGFTEWTNVTRAFPAFEGHIQPHHPTAMGYYDLRLAETRKKQAELAKAYGVHGFCYYHYWFKGKRLLERPFNEVLNSGEPDFPFCLCWANENWTRRWDGQEHEVLIAQDYSPEDDKNFILDIIPALKDPRYIKVNGAPLLMVYRVSLLPDPAQTARLWRQIAHEHGIANLHLVAVQSFDITDPRPFGFDAAVEFPPHHNSAANITQQVQNLNPNFEGNIYDYATFAEKSVLKKCEDYLTYRALFPAWDNTARRQLKGSVFHGSTPELYELWLDALLHQTKKDSKNTEKLVFINAWNEWAEGAHLEPDRHNGFSYLEATQRSLKKASTSDKSQEIPAIDFSRFYFKNTKSIFSKLIRTLKKTLNL